MMSYVKSTQPEHRLVSQILELLSNASASNITKNRTSTEKFTSSSYDKLHENSSTLLNATIICFYALIVVVSFFGNLIVCKIVFNGSSKKSTTNLYIGNLSVSDLMMTIINIPLQLTHVLMRNWPLGFFLCKSLHLFVGMSVSASTLTMALIALDRYRVIVHPLKPRPSYKTTICKMVFVWFIALLLSFPYSLMSQFTTYHAIPDNFTRCTIEYPKPKHMYRQIFTLIAFVLYFAGPLTVSAITYVKICLIIWRRKAIGAVRVDQQVNQRKAKWRTIKMLIIVLVTFLVCWLPLNIYHTYQDARGKHYRKHYSVVWLVCHWFAMSSVCYNPFIYCWLNDKFRKVAISHLQWIFTVMKTKSPTQESHFLARSYSPRFKVFRNRSSSLKFSTFSTQSREFPGGLSRQTSRSDAESRQSFQHTVVATTSDGTICIAKQFPKRNSLIKKHCCSQEKSATIPESFV